MKKIILMASTLLMTQITWAKSQKACFKVEGMTCTACTVTMKVAINTLDGISDIDVSLKKKSAVVDYDDSKTDSVKIKEKIDSVGYKAAKRQCGEG